MATVDDLLFALKVFSALGCGLIGGVFFAFSTFVMKSLGRLQPAQGITAMQSINIVAINPLFMAALFGTAVLCLILAIVTLFKWQSGSAYLLIGCVLYICGTVLVTIIFNVPLNDALARVAPDSTEGAKIWTTYLSNWTMWNHVRTVAALAAAALITFSLYYRMQQS